MTIYDASVALHVLAVVVGFGPTFAYPVIQLGAERHDPDALPFAIATIRRISRTLAVPMATVVGLTGAYQIAEGPYAPGRDAWLAAGIVGYLAVFAVALAYLTPLLARAQAAAERMAADPRAADEFRRVDRRLKLAGGGVGATVVAIVLLMELKPG